MSSAREAAESVGMRLARSMLVTRYYEQDETAIAFAGKLIDQAISAAILAERDACAKVAEEHMTEFPGHFGDDWASGAACAVRDITAAIRARE